MKFTLLFFTLIFSIIFFVYAPMATAQISSPTEVSGLVLWVDGKDINGTGVQPANDSTVTTWVDKSGNSNNLTATLAQAPTFETTGFDGVNPGLRFPVGRKMSATTPFSTTYEDTISIFFMIADVTFTANFVVNLNGDNSAHSISNRRFSFHAPWANNIVYFDAAGCCSSTRLFGASPNAATETTLYTGINDLPGNRQLLRIDGQAFRSDNTGHNGRVDGGVRIGSTSRTQYNGRFAELLIYDRALTTSEIAGVECFLLLKWKHSSAPAGCVNNVAGSKSVDIYDPDTLGLYAIPGNDVVYSTQITHISGPPLDKDTIFIVDSIPDDVIFYNGDMDDDGSGTNPVFFSEAGSGLTLNYAMDVAYSNSATKPTSMTDCTYTPTAGYDANVKHICIRPSGTFLSATPSPSFTIKFRVKIK